MSFTLNIEIFTADMTLPTQAGQEQENNLLHRVCWLRSVFTLGFVAVDWDTAGCTEQTGNLSNDSSVNVLKIPAIELHEKRSKYCLNANVSKFLNKNKFLSDVFYLSHLACPPQPTLVKGFLPIAKNTSPAYLGSCGGGKEGRITLISPCWVTCSL